MRRLILGILLTSALSAFLCAAVPAQAQDDRIRQLEQRVEQLEKRMNTQAAPAAPNKKSSTGDSGWRNRANWRNLVRGMTEGNVRAIMGEPHKIDVNPSFFDWYWNYPSGPYARFKTDSRQLDAWQEP